MIGCSRDEARELDGKERELARDTSTSVRRAGGRREEVEDREVEVERRVAREAVLRHRLPTSPRGPVDECKAVGVREHHALGLAGRAGRVEDVGEVVGVRCARGGAGGVVLDRAPRSHSRRLSCVGPAGGADDGLEAARPLRAAPAAVRPSRPS